MGLVWVALHQPFHQGGRQHLRALAFHGWRQLTWTSDSTKLARPHRDQRRRGAWAASSTTTSNFTPNVGRRTPPSAHHDVGFANDLLRQVASRSSASFQHGPRRTGLLREPRAGPRRSCARICRHPVAVGPRHDAFSPPEGTLASPEPAHPRSFQAPPVAPSWGAPPEPHSGLPGESAPQDVHRHVGRSRCQDLVPGSHQVLHRRHQRACFPVPGGPCKRDTCGRRQMSWAARRCPSFNPKASPTTASSGCGSGQCSATPSARS